MTTLLLAGALLGQVVTLAVPQNDAIQSSDAAYTEMTEGRTDAAITHLREKRVTHPAALINLGTAYARKGMRREALDSFHAAMAADSYQLELADGTWMDSRRAARIAASRLERAEGFAVR